MHQHRTAHRDLMSLNIMLDATLLFPEGHHPVYTLRSPDLKHDAPTVGRTECSSPPKYYLIDFGLSRRYSEDEHWPPVEEIIRGGDKSAPEHNLSGGAHACNPFPTDIYYLGHMIQEEFLEVCSLFLSHIMYVDAPCP